MNRSIRFVGTLLTAAWLLPGCNRPDARVGQAVEGLSRGTNATSPPTTESRAEAEDSHADFFSDVFRGQTAILRRPDLDWSDTPGVLFGTLQYCRVDPAGPVILQFAYRAGRVHISLGAIACAT